MMAMMVYGGIILLDTPASALYIILSMVMASYLVADFISGFVHWLADRYGSPGTPVLGPSFITPFRNHHIDKKGITRHGFFEANGNNSIVTIPFLAFVLCYIPVDSGDFIDIGLFSFGLFLSVWVFATNQFHKWAHSEEVPLYVSILQKMGIILSRAEHERHHVYPHVSNYCITSGLLNRPLDLIGFWSFLEKSIYFTTRIKPFHDSNLNMNQNSAVLE